MARLAAAAAWGLGKWDKMDEYTCMIPREHYDGSLYRAVIAIHNSHYVQAQEVSFAAVCLLCDTDIILREIFVPTRIFFNVLALYMFSFHHYSLVRMTLTQPITQA